MRKKSWLLVLFLLCVALPSYGADQTAADLTLQVEGRAPVVKDDEARARGEAIKNALESAIMQAVYKVLPNKVDDEKIQSLKSVMAGRTDRYIKNYRIISENRQQDQYTASVHAVVALTPLTEDLSQMGVLPDQKKGDGVPVSLSLKGMKKYSDFVFIRSFLQNRSKIIKGVYPCRLEWQRADFDLVLSGESGNLVAEIEKSGRYLLESVHQNQNGIQITLRVKEEVK